jgi:hypothetical protein
MIDFIPAYSKVVLVGNSKSVLEQPMGSQIDQFDIVVRFNNFEINGYQEYVGRKTDIVCRRSCDDVKLHNASNLIKIINFVTYGKWASGMIQVARQLKTYYKDKILNVNIDECEEFGREMGLDQPINEFASIGALACGWFAKRHDPKLITIYGFGYSNSHYFPKSVNDGKFHAWTKEEKFVKSLGFSYLNT